MCSLLFIFSACTPYIVLDGKKKAVTLTDHTLKENTRLSGHIKISGTLTVPSGVVLQIDPGTQIEFIFSDTDHDGIGDGGIVVAGTIMAEGTRHKPILFSGIRTGPKSWSEIRLEYNRQSSFTFSEFRNAHWGLHIHFSHATITSCRFIDNYGGIRFRSGPITIQKSLFDGNNVGIRYIAANPVIRDNVFENNLSAIFIREGSTNPVITGNNFNDGFAVKLGESQQNDIPAPDNYWGSTTETEKVIYDKLDSDYLGRVLYDPIATKPYPPK